MRYLLFFFICFHILFASQIFANKIVIFTKEGCSNCAYTKNFFKEKMIDYEEHSTLDKNESALMLKILQEKEYNGAIFMPVILKNDTLLYPALQTDSGNIKVSLQTALDLLILSNDIVKIDTTNIEKDEEGECMQHYNHYIICANFPSKSAAMRFQSVLILNGYPHAGILEKEGVFHVYASIFENQKAAEIAIKEIKKSYRGSYIFLDLPKE